MLMKNPYTLICLYNISLSKFWCAEQNQQASIVTPNIFSHHPLHYRKTSSYLAPLKENILKFKM